ncbi:aprataxin and PNK-like factor [Anopheles maculipalpis]|uniref:aprataxin and PNK-like factor n=1 Tax=Anopheles maculipalpis TaxID=1496333 RepID=UPI002159913B|nr:aprataxin and PNK-like factor [Anopheles maculipalpis]
MKTLVIIDTSKQTRKIVPEHAQEIGRGKFLECEDKRVSRTHGRITKETKGSKLLLRLESLHINSIFCRKKEGTSDYLLKKDETILLEVGDRFRLIQDGDWFEVGEDTSDIDSQSTAMSVETESQSSRLQEEAPSKRKHDSDHAEDTFKRQRVVGEDSGDEPSTSSQYLSANQSDQADLEKTMSQDINSTDAESAPAAVIKPDPEQLPTSCNIPQVQIKPDPDAEECNTASGPSGGSIAGNVPPVSVKPDPYAMGGKVGLGVMGPGAAVLRPSCDFGIRCYRAGQDHRSAFAHPGDLDYRRPNLPPPPPGTPMCPFGARCYRRNPQHFREYDHPDPNAVLPRTPRHNGASRRQADDDMSDEEYPYESEPDFDDTSSDEYIPGMGEESDDIASEGDDDHDSGLDC